MNGATSGRPDWGPNWRGRLARQPLVLAVAGVLAVAAWQVTTVEVNYQGNYTALFCTAADRELPPAFEHGTYRFANSPGYDGQFYRLVAHDPWLSAGYWRYADSIVVRWRRILVPGLAWALAGGAPARIDGAYLLLILLSAGLGVYALSRWLMLRRRHPAGGLLFLLLPGTLISIDRLTVGGALYALLFLSLVWEEEGKRRAGWIALALCPLTRDIGFLVVAGFIVAELSARRMGRAALWATAALPAMAWYAWLHWAILNLGLPAAPQAAPAWLFSHAGYGILLRMIRPVAYTLPDWQAVAAQVLDQVALIGIGACVFLTLVTFCRREAGKLQWTGLLFAVLFFIAGPEGLWVDLFSWPRAFTPLLAAAAFGGMAEMRRWGWVPLAAVTLRVGLQLGPQVEGIARRIW